MRNYDYEVCELSSPAYYSSFESLQMQFWSAADFLKVISVNKANNQLERIIDLERVI